MVNSFFVSNGAGAANRILRRGERLLPKRYTDRHKQNGLIVMKRQQHDLRLFRTNAAE